MKRTFHLSAWLCTVALASASAAELGGKLEPMFEQHCYDCHDADAKKGGLDLTALKWQPDDIENLQQWTKVFDKVERGFDALIDVFGADHGGYVKRMKAAVSALSDGRVPLDIKLCQLVKLYKNGEPFKMSKRAGNFVTLRDVVDQVGPGVTRFHMLTRKNDAPLDFDFDKVLEQSKDNPVFYVQYAHARVHSVLRRARDAGLDITEAALAKADLSKLDHEAELKVAHQIGEWPRLVEIAARTNEPHRIAFYLYELASDFHSLWNRGNDETSLRFVQEGDMATTAAKIALARAVAVVISAGLGILGVEPMEEMR